MKKIAFLVLMIGLSLLSEQSRAGDELMGVDVRFRAKIAKEKIRIAAQERQNEALGKTPADPTVRCGSQSIGNIDTGGRIGTAPREVFVFAPNAINIVGRGGCK